jgi:hypothetical protein
MPRDLDPDLDLFNHRAPPPARSVPATPPAVVRLSRRAPHVDDRGERVVWFFEMSAPAEDPVPRGYDHQDVAFAVRKAESLGWPEAPIARLSRAMERAPRCGVFAIAHRIACVEVSPGTFAFFRR